MFTYQYKKCMSVTFYMSRKDCFARRDETVITVTDKQQTHYSASGGSWSGERSQALYFSGWRTQDLIETRATKRRYFLSHAPVITP